MKSSQVRELRFATCVVSVAILSLAGSASATVLTFDLSPGGFRPYATNHPDYGDRVTSTSATAANPAYTFGYGEGNGFTPNVVVDYTHQPVVNSQGSSHYNAEASWPDQVNYLHYEDGATFWITLTPDAGYGVNLESFVVELYQNSSNPAGVTFNWAVRQDSTVGPIVASNTITGITTAADPFVSPNVSYGGTLVLEMSYANSNSVGIVGMDDLSFTQFAIPEPGALTLLAAAAMPVAIRRRRRV